MIFVFYFFIDGSSYLDTKINVYYTLINMRLKHTSINLNDLKNLQRRLFFIHNF